MRITFQKADDFELRLTNKEMRLLAKTYKLSLKEVNQLISKLKKDYGDTWFNMSQYKRLKVISGQINQIIKDLRTSTNSTIFKGEKDVYVGSYQITDSTLNSALNIGLSFTLMNNQAIAKAIKNPLIEVSSIERNTKNITQLKTELTKNLILGKSYKSTAKNVSDRFNVALHKADRIVRTENHRVLLDARMDSFKDAKDLGIVMMKEWISAGDSRTRSSHRELGGTQIPVDSYFSSTSGGYGKAPGQMGGSDDINCRCSLAAVIL